MKRIESLDTGQAFGPRIACKRVRISQTSAIRKMTVMAEICAGMVRASMYEEDTALSISRPVLSEYS